MALSQEIESYRSQLRLAQSVNRTDEVERLSNLIQQLEAQQQQDAIEIPEEPVVEQQAPVVEQPQVQPAQPEPVDDIQPFFNEPQTQQASDDIQPFFSGGGDEIAQPQFQDNPEQERATDPFFSVDQKIRDATGQNIEGFTSFSTKEAQSRIAAGEKEPTFAQLLSDYLEEVDIVLEDNGFSRSQRREAKRSLRAQYGKASTVQEGRDAPKKAPDDLVNSTIRSPTEAANFYNNIQASIAGRVEEGERELFNNLELGFELDTLLANSQAHRELEQVQKRRAELRAEQGLPALQTTLTESELDLYLTLDNQLRSSLDENPVLGSIIQSFESDSDGSFFRSVTGNALAGLVDIGTGAAAVSGNLDAAASLNERSENLSRSGQEMIDILQSANAQKALEDRRFFSSAFYMLQNPGQLIGSTLGFAAGGGALSLAAKGTSLVGKKILKNRVKSIGKESASAAAKRKAIDTAAQNATKEQIERAAKTKLVQDRRRAIIENGGRFGITGGLISAANAVDWMEQGIPEEELIKMAREHLVIGGLVYAATAGLGARFGGTLEQRLLDLFKGGGVSGNFGTGVTAVANTALIEGLEEWTQGYYENAQRDAFDNGIPIWQAFQNYENMINAIPQGFVGAVMGGTPSAAASIGNTFTTKNNLGKEYSAEERAAIEAAEIESDADAEVVAEAMQNARQGTNPNLDEQLDNLQPEPVQNEEAPQEQNANIDGLEEQRLAEQERQIDPEEEQARADFDSEFGIGVEQVTNEDGTVTFSFGNNSVVLGQDELQNPQLVAAIQQELTNPDFNLDSIQRVSLDAVQEPVEAPVENRETDRRTQSELQQRLEERFPTPEARTEQIAALEAVLTDEQATPADKAIAEQERDDLDSINRGFDPQSTRDDRQPLEEELAELEVELRDIDTKTGRGKKGRAEGVTEYRGHTIRRNRTKEGGYKIFLGDTELETKKTLKEARQSIDESQNPIEKAQLEERKAEIEQELADVRTRTDRRTTPDRRVSEADQRVQPEPATVDPNIESVETTAQPDPDAQPAFREALLRWNGSNLLPDRIKNNNRVKDDDVIAVQDDGILPINRPTNSNDRAAFKLFHRIVNNDGMSDLYARAVKGLEKLNEGTFKINKVSDSLINSILDNAGFSTEATNSAARDIRSRGGTAEFQKFAMAIQAGASLETNKDELTPAQLQALQDIEQVAASIAAQLGVSDPSISSINSLLNQIKGSKKQMYVVGTEEEIDQEVEAPVEQETPAEAADTTAQPEPQPNRRTANSAYYEDTYKEPTTDNFSKHADGLRLAYGSNATTERAKERSKARKAVEEKLTHTRGEQHAYFERHKRANQKKEAVKHEEKVDTLIYRQLKKQVVGRKTTRLEDQQINDMINGQVIDGADPKIVEFVRHIRDMMDQSSSLLAAHERESAEYYVKEQENRIVELYRAEKDQYSNAEQRMEDRFRKLYALRDTAIAELDGTKTNERGLFVLNPDQEVIIDGKRKTIRQHKSDLRTKIRAAKDRELKNQADGKNPLDMPIIKNLTELYDVRRNRNDIQAVGRWNQALEAAGLEANITNTTDITLLSNEQLMVIAESQSNLSADRIIKREIKALESEIDTQIEDSFTVGGEFASQKTLDMDRVFIEKIKGHLKQAEIIESNLGVHAHRSYESVESKKWKQKAIDQGLVSAWVIERVKKERDAWFRSKDKAAERELYSRSSIPVTRTEAERDSIQQATLIKLKNEELIPQGTKVDGLTEEQFRSLLESAWEKRSRDGNLVEETRKRGLKILDDMQNSGNALDVFVNSDAHADIFKKKNAFEGPEGEAFRAMLGEIKDPEFNFVNTERQKKAYMVAETTARTLYQDGMALGIYSHEQTDTHSEPMEAGIFAHMPGEKIYVTKEAKKAMTDVLGYNEKTGETEVDKMAQFYMSMLAVPKLVITVGDLAVMSANFISSMFATLGQGVNPFSPQTWQMVFNEFSNIRTEIANETGLKRENVTRTMVSRRFKSKFAHIGVDDGITQGSLKEQIAILEKNKGMLVSEDSDSTYSRMARQVGEKGKWLGSTANALYGYGDDIWRFYSFMAQKNYWMGQKTASGTPFTEQQAEDRAAERVQNGFFTYSRVPEFMKELNRKAPISAFSAFAWESGRFTVNNARYAWADHKAGNHEAAAMRGLGLSAAALAPMLLARASMMLLDDNLDEDDYQMASNNHPFTPNEYQIVTRDTNGDVKGLNLSRHFYFSGYLNAFNTLVRDEGSGANEGVAKAVSQVITPWAQEDIAADWFFNWKRNKDKDGRPIYGDGTVKGIFDMNSDELLQSALSMTKLMSPGILKNQGRYFAKAASAKLVTEQEALDHEEWFLSGGERGVKHEGLEVWANKFFPRNPNRRDETFSSATSKSASFNWQDMAPVDNSVSVMKDAIFALGDIQDATKLKIDRLNEFGEGTVEEIAEDYADQALVHALEMNLQTRYLRKQNHVTGFSKKDERSGKEKINVERFLEEFKYRGSGERNEDGEIEIEDGNVIGGKEKMETFFKSLETTGSGYYPISLSLREARETPNQTFNNAGATVQVLNQSREDARNKVREEVEALAREKLRIKIESAMRRGKGLLNSER